MNLKITKSRLKTFFAYDAVKLVAAVVITVLLLWIILNALAKKPSNGQDFYMMVADDVVISDEARALPSKVKDGDAKYKFSYDVLNVNTLVINPAGYSSAYMMNTYCELGEDDVFICIDDGDESLYNQYTNLYWGEDIVSYATYALNFLKDNGFISESGEFTDEKTEEYFLKTRKKDARFRKKAAREQGVKQEAERLKRVYDNAKALLTAIDAHPELLYDEKEIKISDKYSVKGKFAINLGALDGNPAVNGKKQITDLFARKVYDDGGNVSEITADKVLLLVGRNEQDEGDLYYESLAFINTLLFEYSTFLG